MCREYKVIPYLTKDEIEPIVDKLEISAEVVEDPNILVIINGIDGECLCSLSLSQKERIIEFLDYIIKKFSRFFCKFWSDICAKMCTKMYIKLPFNNGIAQFFKIF